MVESSDCQWFLDGQLNDTENCPVEHQDVAESAVVGRDNPISRQATAAFVILDGHVHGSGGSVTKQREHTTTKIGKIARPTSAAFTDELPNSRSRKSRDDF